MSSRFYEGMAAESFFALFLLISGKCRLLPAGIGKISLGFCWYPENIACVSLFRRNTSYNLAGFGKFRLLFCGIGKNKPFLCLYRDNSPFVCGKVPETTLRLR
jgi:hypothetical protein